MSKERQIEEMAKIFCGMKNGCDGCMFSKVHCNERNYAEEIYNAGYRKIPENIGEFSDGYHTFNELYHHRAVLEERAETKQEIAKEIFEEIEQWLGDYNGCRVITSEKFAELKKKYTEE